ncbi:MAG: hypothetical protein ACI4KA_07735 [Oscillospiraceae bacterium]
MMFHNEHEYNPAITYPVIAVMLILLVVLPSDKKGLVFAVLILLLGLMKLSHPVWYWMNRRRIQHEWVETKAAVLECIVTGTRVKHCYIKMASVDAEGKCREFIALQEYFLMPRIGDTRKIKYDSKNPADFIMIPEYKCVIVGHMFMALVFIALGALGIWFVLF